MITDPRVFREDHRPQALLHRDAEVSQLIRLLQPAAHGDGAEDVLLSGPSGVGKTALVRYALDRLWQHAGVEHAYVRALGKTAGDVLRAFLRAHPASNGAASNQPTEHIATRLRECLDNAPLVAVLDEADDVPETDLLDRVGVLPGLSLVCICHDAVEWRGRLPDRSSRWGGKHHLGLDRYSVDELANILERRAHHGLRRGSVTRERLEQLANDAAGVARQGIQRLRAAAELADEHEHRRIQPRDVVDSAERAEHRIRELSLRSLPYHHQVLYALVYQAAPVTSQALHDRYDAVADDVYQGRPVEPISRRSRRNKLQKLRAYDLLDVRGANGCEHAVVDEAVTPRVDLPESAVQ